MKSRLRDKNAKNVSFEGTLLPSAVKNPMKNQVSMEILYPGMSKDSFPECFLQFAQICFFGILFVTYMRGKIG